MKRSTMFVLFFAIIAIQTALAQTGLTGINYQAVARNTNGTVLANQPVKVKISIFGGSANGTLQYQESHSLSTNQLGLFTLQIGKGTVNTGTFAAVPWQSANQYLKVELAIAGGNFSDLGTTQLMSVPYALFAANSSPGATGPQGLQGPVGPAGVNGAVGPAGANGTDGAAGAPGLKGGKGDKGDQGTQGIQGFTGAVGPAGANGTNGAAGAPGLKGDKGDKGDQGTQGIQGFTGAVGPAGANGTNGTAGTPGSKGDKGDPGAVGPAGVAGPQGPIGPKGDPGDITASAAGGDLAGTYPNPKVIALQSKPVSNVVPLADQYLKFDGTKWIPSAVAAGAAFTLPYSATETNINPLFSIENKEVGAAIKGVNSFSGSSSTGVWGTSVGIGNGVSGSSDAGTGIVGTSETGSGIVAVSNSGHGLEVTSNTGTAAVFAIKNPANQQAALIVQTNGGGSALLAISESSTAGYFRSNQGLAIKTDKGNVEVNGKVKIIDGTEGLNKVLTSDANGTASWQTPVSGANFILPYSGVSSVDNVIPFSITNNSASLRPAGNFENTSISNSEPAIVGSNKSEENFGVGVQGYANSNTTSKTSAAVSGQLYGSGKFGAGILGYAENATGVSGSTEKGVGVSGLSTAAGGYAGLFNGNAGSTALLTIGALRFQSIGEAAGKVLTSDAAGNATWQTPATAAGFTLPYSATQSSITPLFNLVNSGTDVKAVAIRAEITATTGLFSDAVSILGENKNTAVNDFQSAGIKGTHAGYGIGIYGVSEQGRAIFGISPLGVGVTGSSNSGTGLMAFSAAGPAAEFQLTNPTNPNNVLTITTAGAGKGVNVTTVKGTGVDATNTGNDAFVTAITGTISSQGTFASALRGVSTGVQGIGIWGSQDNSGWGVYGTSVHGNGVFASTTDGAGVSGAASGSGYGVYGASATGIAGFFNNTVQANTSTALKAVTVGSGAAIEGINSSNATNAVAVRGEISSTSAGSLSIAVRGENKNLGSNGYGVYGTHAGVGGTGVYGTVNNGIGVFGESKSGGNGVYATSIDGIGLRAISQNGAAATFASGTGLAIKTTKGNVEINGQINVNDASVGGQAINVQTTGAAIAGYFVNLSGSTASPAVSALTFGTGPALIATAFGAPGTSNVAVFKNSPIVSASPPTNVARIDNAGKGFFNGGTQNSGADIAEAFDVSGNVTAYEPGDILVISQDKDRAVEKSGGVYSNLVAGVYATKPGVLLTEEHMDADISNKVPMGVIGVIPTKVCMEGGAIKRGDMLVTSSQAGVGMKADLKRVKVGEVLGKALEAFDGVGVQKIKVLVNIK